MSDLPPIEPRDFTNRPNREGGSNYPPQGMDYPPRGVQPSNPNAYPQASNYPPPGQNYPPPNQGQQGDYPPQQLPPQPGPNYPPPGVPSYPPPQRMPDPIDEFDDIPDLRRDVGSSRPTPDLDDFNAPDLRRRVSREELGLPVEGASRPSRGGFQATVLSERQVEALGWGITVILLGIAILLFFTGSSDFLTVGFPILGGGTLLVSSVYQRLRMWNVSILTWTTAIGLCAFSVTRLLAISDGKPTGLGTSLAYFTGISIIISGVIVLIRIFRTPSI